MLKSLLLTAQLLLLTIGFFIPLPSLKAQFNGVADLATPGASLKLVSNKFKFTEGPAVDKEGNIFFTDQPNDKIWKYDTSGTLSVFLEPAGRSNGLYFDRKGNLLACADEQNELWSITPDKKIRVLLNGFEGRKFHGPNDLWVSARGGIYFTDPHYNRSYWKGDTVRTRGEKTYYLPPGKSAPLAVDAFLKRPNGIVGTADGKVLYVADQADKKTYRFNINKNGSLANRTLFANMGSDGMTLDEQGNVYLTGNGVTIFNKEGTQIGHIAVPAKWTANICFGGPLRKTLFITASESVFTLDMQVKGIE